MQYFKDLLKALQDIATNLKANQDPENKLHNLHYTTGQILIDSWASYMSQIDIIKNSLVEDSRDTGVMIDRKKAVKIVTINWKAERTETFTREASLSKDEKAHYKKHGIVLIVNI